MATALTAIQGYNSNSIPGIATVGNDVDIYEINTNQKYALGTQITREDGSKFRYGSFISAVTQGKVVSHIVADVDNPSTNALVNAPSSTYQQGGEQVGIYPGSLGSRYVLYTLASVIKDQFAGGYLTVNLDTGVGYIYRIKGNTATGNPASGKVLIELYDKLQVALDATSDTGLLGSLYTDLFAATPGTDFVTVGVTVANMTAGTYGWICTHGICACLQDGTVASGDIIQLSVATAGAYQTLGVGTTTVAAAAGQNLLGYSVQVPAGGSAGYGAIYLQLE